MDSTFKVESIYMIKKLSEQKYELQKNPEKTAANSDRIYFVDNHYSCSTADQTD